MPGITCLIPPGAFYVFPDVTGIIGSRVDGRTVNSDAELADVLLDVARVSVVPGAAFGSSGNLRFSYATSMKNIEEGMDRFEAFLGRID